ncbi:hypothetical protein ZEAMMB73_Zm00001d004000 [Zea mays]|uniref:Uncharacterized protein n=1 Tax=Zea mays TaxID=4577 RepID=A0A1D6ECV1_MAIZE|nr:hypothetical protein ZEAMMB73_Zm00001d004000 [Zea mays]
MLRMLNATILIRDPSPPLLSITPAYKVLVAASRTMGGKPLTYIPQSSSVATGPPVSPASSASSTSSASLQRSLTSAAASKMKKALVLRSSASSKGVGSPGSGGKAAPPRRPATVGELMWVQMRISEPADARIHRGSSASPPAR